MELILLLIIAWLLSPPILAVLLVNQRKKTKYYKDMYESSVLNGRNERRSSYAEAIFKDMPPVPLNVPKGNVPPVPPPNFPEGAPPPPPYNMPPQSMPFSAQSIPLPPQNTSVSRTIPAPAAPPVRNTASMGQTVPAKQSVPAPTPKPEKTAEENKVSSMNIMLILGAMFIIISGLIFATTSWQFLSSGIRAAVILSFSIVFFAVSALAEKKLRLEKTGLLFYTLGSVFLPITLIASGYFKVFGEWFSLFGEGRPLLLSLTFLSLSIASLRGSAKYSSTAFAYTSLFSFSAAICSMLIYLTPDMPAFSLAAAVYGLIMIIAAENISKLKSEKFSSVISAVRNFAAINTVLLSISSFIAAGSGDHGTLTLASCALFSAGYIKSSFSEKNGFGAAVPFAVFMTCGMFSAFAPKGLDGAANTLAAASAVTAVLSFMNIIPDKAKDAFRYVSGFFAGVTLAVCAAAAFTVPPSWISFGAYMILSAEILSLGILHREEKSGKLMLYIFPASLSVAAAMLSRLAFREVGIPSEYCVFALFILINAVLQTVFVFAKKINIRTLSSDIIFSAAGIIAEILLLTKYEYAGNIMSAVYLASFAISAYTVIAAAADREQSVGRTLFAGISAFWTSLGAYALARTITDLAGAYYEETALFISSAAFIVILSAASFIANKKAKDSSIDTAISVSLRIASAIYCLTAIDHGMLVSVLLAMMSAYSILRYMKTHKEYETLISLITAFLGAILFAEEISAVTLVSYTLLSILALCAVYAARGKDTAGQLTALLPFILTSFSVTLSLYTENIFIYEKHSLLVFGAVFLVMSALFQLIFIFGKGLRLRTVFSDITFSFAAVLSVILSMSDNSDGIYGFIITAVLLIISVAVISLPAIIYKNKRIRNILTLASFAWTGLGMGLLTSVFINAGISPAYDSTAYSVSFSLTSAVMVTVSCVIAHACKDKVPSDISALMTRIISGIYILFIITLCLASEEYFAFVSPIFILLAALSAARAKKYSSKPEFISALLLFIASAGALSYDAVEEEAYLLLSMSLAAALLYAAAMTLWKNKEYFKTAETVTAYSLGALNFLCLLYISSDAETAPYLILTAAMFILAVFAFYKKKDTLFTALPLSAVYFAVSNQVWSHLCAPVTADGAYPVFNAADISVLLMIAASLAMSRILHKDALTERHDGGLYADTFAFSRFFGVIAYASVITSEESAWLVWLLLGICTYSLKKSSESENAKNLIYTVSAVFPVIAWLTEPFFTMPDILKTELILLPILIYFTVLKLIWKNKQALMESIHFVAFAFCLTVLFFDAMDTGELTDGLITVIFSFFVLMYSFLVKKRKWFILSAAVIVVSTLFMSRGFWASLAWWVYLLAAGLIFIAVGAANEMKKQAASRDENSAFAEKVTRFMSDWTW